MKQFNLQKKEFMLNLDNAYKKIEELKTKGMQGQIEGEKDKEKEK